MDPTRIGLKTFLIAAAAVALVEAGARWIPMDPLLLTLLIRLVDILIVSGVLLWFQKGLKAVGLDRNTAYQGLRTGLFWSAACGGLVVAAAGILTVSGISFLPLFRASLPASPERLLLFFLAGGVIGPIAEELVYRGLIYSVLRQWGVIFAVSGSTLLFVLSHFPDTALPLPQLVGGIVFALAYERAKSLAAPVIIHILGNNALFSLALAHQWVNGA